MKTYKIVIIGLKIKNKLKKARFFLKTFFNG